MLRIKPLFQIGIMGIFLYSPLAITAQGEYISDKTNSCKCFTYLNPNAKRTFTYQGTCNNGYISGIATVTFYLSGEMWSIFSGNFDQGFLNGQGSVEYVDAYKYVGGFMQSKMHGKGKITDFRSGFIMEANFVDGKLTGNVKINFKNGDSYTGTVRTEQWTIKEGNGIYYFNNGNRYEGLFSKDVSDAGTMYYKNGSTAKGKLTGEEYNYTFIETGTTIPNQTPVKAFATTKGGFIWSKDRSCQIYTTENADKRSFTYTEGKCKKSYLQGKAKVELYENDVRMLTISGNYVDGKVSGEVDMQFSNGVKFTGEITEDFFKVKGQLTYQNGDVFTGVFNKYYGREEEGILKFTNGEWYEGRFTATKNGTRYLIEQGGIYHFNNGDVFTGIEHLSHDDYIEGRVQHKNGKIEFMQLESVPGANTMRLQGLPPDFTTADNFDQFSNASRKLDALLNNTESFEEAGIIDNDGKILPWISLTEYSFKSIKNGILLRLQFSDCIFSNSGFRYYEFDDDGKYNRSPFFGLKSASDKDKVLSYLKFLKGTGAVKLADMIEAGTNPAIADSYIKITGSNIKYGYFTDPQRIIYTDNDITFRGLQRKEVSKAFFSPGTTTEYMYRSYTDYYQSIKWKDIRSMSYGEYDIINDGYMLTIYGRFENEKGKKMADSHSFFVPHAYAQVYLKVLNKIKNSHW